MKIHGQVISRMGVQTLVFPRDGDGRIVIRVAPVVNYDAFDQLCPEPNVPFRMEPGKAATKNPENPEYKKAMDAWSEKRMNYMMIRSLEATEGLEWETIDIQKPETWSLDKEMESTGFSALEKARIMNAIILANGLNNDLIDEATKSFLAEAHQTPKL